MGLLTLQVLRLLVALAILTPYTFLRAADSSAAPVGVVTHPTVNPDDPTDSSPEVIPQRADLTAPAQAKALAQALYAQAIRREMQDGFEAALPLYLGVLKADPQFEEMHVKLAYSYLFNREPDKAMEQLEAGALANPKSATIQAAIAHLHQVASHFEAAATSARKALELDPGNAVAHRILFEALRDSNRLAEAMQNVTLLTRFTSPNAKIWAELARTYTEVICASTHLSQQELSAQIMPLYEKAFATGEPSSELLAQRGEFYHFLGQKEQALSDFEKASQKGEPSPELFIRVANLHSQLGHVAEAIKNYEAAYELSPNMQLLREQLAYQYVLAGEEAKAIGLLEEILHRSPTRSSVYSALADLYQQALQPQKAEQNYRAAIKMEPSNPENYLKLALLMMNQKRLSEGATLLQEARSRFPAHARVALFEAIIQREKGDLPSALDLFAQAKILADEKDKEFPYASYYYELSLAQEAAGKPQLSEGTLKEGLNIDPNNENLLNALAYLWAEQGKSLPEALKLSKRSLQISPDKGEFLDTLAWIQFKLEHYPEALALVERAAKLTQDHSEVLAHLAEIYWKVGKTTEAVETLNKILDKEPNNSIVRERLEKMKKESPLVQSKISPSN